MISRSSSPSIDDSNDFFSDSSPISHMTSRVTSPLLDDSNVFLPDSSHNSCVVSKVSRPSPNGGSGYHFIKSPHLPHQPRPNGLNLELSNTARLSSLSPSRGSVTTPSMQGPGPIPMSNGKFMCPQCPRTFSRLIKAGQHLEDYQHRHACPVNGCRWSFRLHKDLRRHSLQHAHRPQRFACPVVGCAHRRPGSDNTFSRLDLLKRHMRNFHPLYSIT